MTQWLGALADTEDLSLTSSIHTVAHNLLKL